MSKYHELWCLKLQLFHFIVIYLFQIDYNELENNLQYLKLIKRILQLFLFNKYILKLFKQKTLYSFIDKTWIFIHIMINNICVHNNLLLKKFLYIPCIILKCFFFIFHWKFINSFINIYRNKLFYIFEIPSNISIL